VGRLLIPIAAMIIIAGIITVSYRVGYRAGRARQRQLGESVDPQLVNDLAGLLTRILFPADPVNTVVLIPDEDRKDGVALLQRATRLRRNIYPTE
jgi:hypothetical protein